MSCKHNLDNCPECGPGAREGGAMTFAENRLVDRLSRAPGVPIAAAGISSPPPSGSAFPPVLDACCGSRMFWFDRKDSRAVFVDKRQERHTLPDVSSAGGARELVIDPDHVADFTALPFPSDTFALVVFDPPHFERNGARSWVGLKYGTLAGDWPEMLRAGFAECFRVLRPEGTLIFKWCADEIPVSRILALTPERPLFGHKSGKNSKTHWVAFLKPNTPLR